MTNKIGRLRLYIYGYMPLLTTILLLILVGCSIDPQKKIIFDRDSRIVQDGDSYHFTDRIGKVDENDVDLTYSGFYGVQTLWVIKTEKMQEITIDYNSQVKSGDFKIVVVTPKREVQTITQQKSKGMYKFVAVKGTYKVKIVGRKANGEIQLKLHL